MAKVLKELAVAVASYTDRNTGQQKNRYRNIGILMEHTNERGEVNRFLMIDRSFNPAGVPFKPDSDKILVSMFDPRDNQSGGGSQGGGSQSDSQGQGGAAAGGGRSEYGDEIPFAPCWWA